jgi:hypothetical protein
MYAFTDRLQDFDVECGSATVIPVVLELFIPDDAVGALYGSEDECRVPCDAGDD